MSRILIAGAAGFLGGHLAEHFLSQGHHVICLDRHDDMSFVLDGRAELCRCDVATRLPRIMGPLDYVLHFASHASPIDFMRSPMDTLLSNSQGTLNLLALAEEKKAVFVFASTSHVLSDTDPSTIRGVYVQAKRFGEAMTAHYAKAVKLNAKIIRMFNVYGPGMRLDDGRVIPAFITKALRGEEITIQGGNQMVSFTYVDDMVDAIDKTMQFDTDGKPVEFGADGDGRLSIVDLARKIVTLTGSPSQARCISPAAIYNEREPNPISKAMIGWEPRVGIEEGLRRTIEDFKRRMP